MATLIKATTQRGKAFINSYEKSTNKTLSDVYTTWSNNKEQAYCDCIKWMTEENGEEPRILGASPYTFSIGWKTADGLRVETAKGSYIIK